METSTDLKTVLAHPGRFTWGSPIATHVIGEYTIIEFRDNLKQIWFFPYVCGVSTNCTTSSLQEALLFAMAWEHHNDSTKAGYMAEAAAKVLGVI